jgi:hypothetical protein
VANVESASDTDSPFRLIDKERNLVDNGRNLDDEVRAAIESSIEYSSWMCSSSIDEMGCPDDDDDDDDDVDEETVLPRLTRDKRRSNSSWPSFSAAALLVVLVLVPLDAFPVGPVTD